MKFPRNINIAVNYQRGLQNSRHKRCCKNKLYFRFFFLALKQPVLFSTHTITHNSLRLSGLVFQNTTTKTFHFKPMTKLMQARGAMAAYDDTDGLHMSRIDASARFHSSVYCRKVYASR